jgi:hypothetical protein
MCTGKSQNNFKLCHICFQYFGVKFDKELWNNHLLFGINIGNIGINDAIFGMTPGMPVGIPPGMGGKPADGGGGGTAPAGVVGGVWGVVLSKK